MVADGFEFRAYSMNVKQPKIVGRIVDACNACRCVSVSVWVNFSQISPCILKTCYCVNAFGVKLRDIPNIRKLLK